MSKLSPVEQAELDAAIYGTAYLLKKQNGEFECINPQDVIIILPKKDDSDGQ